MIFDEREVPLAMPNSLTKEFGSYLSKMQCPILDVEVNRPMVSYSLLSHMPFGNEGCMYYRSKVFSCFIRL